MRPLIVFILWLVVFCSKYAISIPQEDLIDSSSPLESNLEDQDDSKAITFNSNKKEVNKTRRKFFGGVSKLINRINNKTSSKGSANTYLKSEEIIDDNLEEELMKDILPKGVSNEKISGIGKIFSSGFGSIKDKLGGVLPSPKNNAFYDKYNQFLQNMYTKMFKMAAYKEQADKTKIKEVNSTDKNAIRKKVDEIREQSNFWVSVPLFKNILGRTCFRDIGCFSATEYHDFSRRPIPLLPMAPEFIDPVFHIFTVKNKVIPQNYSYNATAKELKKSSFDPKLKTIFITHGFRSGFEPWVKDLKDSLFNQTKAYNIIIVVWTKGAKVPMYHLAATNTRVVGAMMAFFIEILNKTFKLSNDRFWLIGHSLGGHVVAYAGKRLNNPKVARITGLDPSGPGFKFGNTTMRLHYTDATLVDSFHTDVGQIFSEGLGVEEKFGYFDFYPNGGLGQPGCKTSKGILNMISAISTGEEISCSHSRAQRFAISVAIKPWLECQPIGYECTDYDTFIEGRCFDCREGKCQPMGLNPDNWLKPFEKALNYKYYLNLGPNEEFCVNHYQFGFHVSQDSDESNGIIELIMSIITENNVKKVLTFKKIMSDIQIGEIHTLLMTFQFKLKNISLMQIQWKRWDKPKNIDKNKKNQDMDPEIIEWKDKGKRIKIPIIEINYMSHLNQSVRDKSSFIMCPQNGSDTEIIVNSQKIEYIVCNPLEMDPMDMAKVMVSEQLPPFTKREDLISNDYENVNSVVEKVTNSKMLNKTLMNNKVVNFLG